MPYAKAKDIVYCKAVGNTFKMVRREAFPLLDYDNSLNTFGDDGQVCQLVEDRDWRTAFCSHIYSYHAGQCDNWGYSEEELAQDPRKEGYAPPFKHTPVSTDTYEPPPELKLR